MENLENIAPNLSKIKKEVPFKVPENYFEDFQSRLQTRIEEEEFQKIPYRNKIIRILKPVIGLAAGFALIFILVRWPISKLNDRQIATSQVSSDEVYYALLEEVDENSLYSVLDNNSAEEPLSSETLANYLVASLSEYDIYIESK